MVEKNDIRFLLTGDCNYKCYFCHHEGVQEKSGNLLISDDYSKLYKIYSKYYNFNGVTLSGGEPLVREDVIEIAKKLYQDGAKITLVTNGYLLDKKIEICKYINRINLSIHTVNSNNYEKIVCVKNTYNKVMDNIKLVRKLYPNMQIRLNATLVKGVNWSSRELEELIEFSKKINSSIKFTELFPSKDENCVGEEDVIKELLKYGYARIENDNRSKVYKNKNHKIYLTRCVCETAKLTSSPIKYCIECSDLYVNHDGTFIPCRLKKQKINIIDELKNNDTNALLNKILLAKRKIKQEECNECLKAI